MESLMMPYKFCSTQVNLPLILQTDAIRCSLDIPERLLAMDGREKVPHLTIQYGLKSVPPETIRELVASLPAFVVEFGNVQKFPSRGQGDVLYIAVKDAAGNGGLSQLRRRLKDFVDPEREDFNKYQPHVTLAYVRAGEAEHLVDQPCSLTGKTHLVSAIMYCEKGGVMHECSLMLRESEPFKAADRYKFLTERVDK